MKFTDMLTEMVQLKVGDKVQYSTQFLRSTGEYTGNVPKAKGVVKKLTSIGSNRHMAEVDWDLKDVPKKILTTNLSKIK